MRPMKTAPRKEGTHILIKTQMWYFDFNAYEYRPDGTRWIEAWRKDGKWVEWCGNLRISTTDYLYPLGWEPLPED